MISHLFLGARGLSVGMSNTGGLENAHDDFGRRSSPVLPLMLSTVLEDAKEIINFLSLTRKTYSICTVRHVQSGGVGS